MRHGFNFGFNYNRFRVGGGNTAFIIEIDTSKAGSNSDQFQLTGAQGNYDVVAKQNGIVVQTFRDLSDQETITFNNGSGVYILEVKAKSVNGFTGLRFNDSGDKLKLSKINQWGLFADNRQGLFFGCLNLNTLANDIEWLNIVTDGSQMFQDCPLQSLPFEMTLANLQNGTDMFRGCPLTSLPFQMILSNLQSGSQMFRGCPLQSLPSEMTLSNLENGFLIFLGSQLTLLPSAIALANLQNGSLMFLGSNINTVRYSKLLVDMQNLNTNTNVTFHGGNSKYNYAGEVARNLLINNQSWSFSDGGLIPTLTIQIDSTKNGTSNNNQFQFTGAEGDYDILAKQGGNVIETFNNLSDEATITFTNAGVYDLHIFPKAVNGFSRIKFNNSGDDEKVKDIKQWGNIVWSSFEGAFFGCKNMLVTATDIPNLSQVTSMDSMFRGASIANPDTTNWNTSNVTSMFGVFMSTLQFNQPLNNWDVSNVTNIRAMFLNAFAFNQPLNNWNTSNVTQMRETFLGARLFNQNINNWDVSGVENMTTMFYNTQAFNQPLNNWDLSNITTMHMFLEQSNMSAQNLADCYKDWSQLNLQQNVQFSAGTIKYNSSGQSGRNVLINTYNWSITDGGQA
jgi:surface protein